MRESVFEIKYAVAWSIHERCFYGLIFSMLKVIVF